MKLLILAHAGTQTCLPGLDSRRFAPNISLGPRMRGGE